MSAPEKPHKPVELDPQPQPPLNLGSAVLSFFLPGLGQLFQGRILVSLGYFFLYVVVGAIPCMFIYIMWSEAPPWMQRDSAPWLLLLLPLFLLVLLFSALDAAKWKPGESSYLRRPFHKLVNALAFAGFFCAIAVFAQAVSDAREAAHRMQCTGYMKQLALALHNYHDKYKSFPPAYTVDQSGKPLHSWRVLILPFIEHKGIYDKIRLDEPWDSEYNSQFHSLEMNRFHCPSDKQRGARSHLGKPFSKLHRDELNCNYSVVIGEQTIFPGSRHVAINQIKDGTSNTILVVERIFPVCWMDPTHEITFDDACLGVNVSIYGLGSGHKGGCNAALADGSVHFISETIEPETLKAALTKAGGEEVTLW